MKVVKLALVTHQGKVLKMRGWSSLEAQDKAKEQTQVKYEEVVKP